MTAKTLAIVDPTDRADGLALVWDAADAIHKYIAGLGAAVSPDGWVAAGEAWTYASADDPTFTFTVPGDLTGKYQAGMKIKLTQTTAKYFIVTKVAHAAGTTTITIYGGTDYDLANAAITLPYYSVVRSPFGFPMDPAKWTVSLNYGGGAQANATAGTIYNLTNIVVPIGAWEIKGNWNHYASGSTAAQCAFRTGLSTANSTFSDGNLVKTMTAYIYTNTAEIRSVNAIRKFLALAAKTTYYVNIATIQNAGTTTVGIAADCYIEAVCAYL